MGIPGVFQGYLYPYPSKPVPVGEGTGFSRVRVRGLTGLAGTETLAGLEYRYLKFIGVCTLHIG